MIDGNIYVTTVRNYFDYLHTEFGMKVREEKIRGNAFYDVQYGNETKIVSVSYENIEDYLEVTVFILDNGELPDYDDKSKTLHLSKLNSTILSKVSQSEIVANNMVFSSFHPESKLNSALLKAAKELRICLSHIE